MAITSPKMGLRIWTALKDAYDHSQLADNWSKLDFHDHSPGRGVLIPTEGLADASITQGKLASDVGGAFTSWKCIREGHSGTLAAGSTAGTYLIPTTGSSVAAVPQAAHSNAFYLDPADFAITGRTTQFRLRVSAVTNAVAPAVSITFGLRSVSTWGGASASIPTVATIGGSDVLPTAVLTTPGATTATSVVSPAGTLTAGWYVVAGTFTGTSAAGSIVGLQAVLQMRQN